MPLPPTHTALPDTSAYPRGRYSCQTDFASKQEVLRWTKFNFPLNNVKSHLLPSSLGIGLTATMDGNGLAGLTPTPIRGWAGQGNVKKQRMENGSKVHWPLGEGRVQCFSSMPLP